MNAPPDPLSAAEDERAMAQLNHWLEKQSVPTRIQWGLTSGAAPAVMTSSFGIDSAALLHLVTQQAPNIPVIFIDTGHLFPETHDYRWQLVERLQLNLHVYRPKLGSAGTQVMPGTPEELDEYHQHHKVEPLQRALHALSARTWFAGLRRVQSTSRAATSVVALRHGRWKVHPLATWTDDDLEHYSRKHDLPEHPLKSQGYASVGDKHTSRPRYGGEPVEQTRFFGWKRECGIHL